METNYILALIAVMVIVAAMGFLSATPIIKKYYTKQLQAENQVNLVKTQLKLKIFNLKNKLKLKKKNL